MLRADFSQESHPGDSKDPPDPRWIVTLDSAIGKNDLGYVAPVGYRTYSITPCGVTILHNVNHNTDPLEFVSPTEKLTFGPKSQWRMNVEKHWETLLQIVEVEINGGCATHVHVSPRKEERWTLEQLKPIAKAVIYFNDAFKEIYAPSRRNHDFTYSNKDDNYKLKDQDFAECCKLIDNCASKDAIINLMQAGKTKADHQSRYYAWNFENTEEGKKGSIGASQDLQPPSERNPTLFQSFAAPQALRRSNIVSSGWSLGFPSCMRQRNPILVKFSRSGYLKVMPMA